MISIIVSILTFFTALIIHELGHWYALSKYKDNVIITFYHSKVEKKYIFKVGQHDDYKDLSVPQQLYVYFAGILAGVIVIIGVSYALSWIYLVVLVPNILMSQDDFRNIKRCFKELWHI
jgi:hypothetical protein